MLRTVFFLIGLFLPGQVMLPHAAASGEEIKRVKRYDDAQDRLPKAIRENKHGVRLYLPQLPNEANFEVITPRKVGVAVFWRVPEGAKAAVVLLPGGSGVLSLAEDGKLGPSFNIFSRSRDYFHQNGIATFLVDASSDRLDKKGWTQSHRKYGKHAGDLAAVLQSVKAKFDGPVFVAGHSNGSISAVNASVNDAAGTIAGLILSASVTQKGRGHVSSFDIDKTTVPVLAIHHANDKCRYSPPGKAAKLKSTLKAEQFDYIAIEGGVERIGGECSPFSAHSFFGAERKYADVISEWILKQVRRPL